MVKPPFGLDLVASGKFIMVVQPSSGMMCGRNFQSWGVNLSFKAFTKLWNKLVG
jgi:hypothetical protein